MFKMSTCCYNENGTMIWQSPKSEIPALPPSRSILQDGEVYRVAKDKILTVTSVEDGTQLMFINANGQNVREIFIKTKKVEIYKYFSILSISTADGQYVVTVQGEPKGTFPLVYEREEEEDIVGKCLNGSIEILASIYD